jgi:hypothetical protein
MNSNLFGAGAPVGGGSGMDGTGSTVLVLFIHYLGKIQPKLQEKSADFSLNNITGTGFSDSRLRECGIL